MNGRVLASMLVIAASSAVLAEEPMQPYAITGDMIARPLTGQPGNARRGEQLVADRQAGLCLLCHQGPFPEPHAQGTLAPDLRGVGGRLSEGQLRLRLVDMRHINPSSIMPSYYRITDRTRVAETWHGRPLLNAHDIEDIVAFLTGLKE